MRALALAALALAGAAGAGASAPVPAPEILQDLRSFREMGSVLYIAAHPDDENTQLITYFARGRCYRTAYLSLTRGDGGQNVLGPEFGDLLGVIRTQELLAARRVDGGRQFFSRARDFGYSKDYRDTLTKWDRQQVLSDIVSVIRVFRPDVVVTRFPPDPGAAAPCTGRRVSRISRRRRPAEAHGPNPSSCLPGSPRRRTSWTASTPRGAAFLGARRWIGWPARRSSSSTRRTPPRASRPCSPFGDGWRPLPRILSWTRSAASWTGSSRPASAFPWKPRSRAARPCRARS